MQVSTYKDVLIEKAERSHDHITSCGPEGSKRVLRDDRNFTIENIKGTVVAAFWYNTPDRSSHAAYAKRLEQEWIVINEGEKIL